MFLWGLLLLAQATNPVVTKLVMEPDCHIPAAPPCIPFDDPRWKVEGCRVDDGACFVIGVEAKRPEIWATLSISPRCGDRQSRTSLRDSALIALFDSGYNFFSFEERVVKCSKKGFVDVRLLIERADK